MISIVLAAVGQYGVMAYAVRRRLRHIGIRRALGADSRIILKRMVKEGMTLAVIGIGLGVGGGLALNRLMGALLFWQDLTS